jgi:hypothetical protein
MGFNINRLLYGTYSKYVFSIILGFGLATLFRKVCKDQNCIRFTAPNLKEMEDKIYQFNNQCYKFKPKAVTCNKTKKQVMMM